MFVNSFNTVSGTKKITPLPVTTLIPGKEEYKPTPTKGYLFQSTPTPEFTQTPYYIIVTSTPTPTPTKSWFEDMYIPEIAGIANKPERVYDSLSYAKISYYYPPLAYQSPEYEINCDKVNGVLECEHMASGELVKYFMGEALACPIEYPFGTIFEIEGRYFTCRDRGGAIVRIDEKNIWLDILYPHMPFNLYWGQSVVVKIWLPVMSE